MKCCLFQRSLQKIPVTGVVSQTGGAQSKFEFWGEDVVTNLKSNITSYFLQEVMSNKFHRWRILPFIWQTSWVWCFWGEMSHEHQILDFRPENQHFCSKRDASGQSFSDDEEPLRQSEHEAISFYWKATNSLFPWICPLCTVWALMIASEMENMQRLTICIFLPNTLYQEQNLCRVMHNCNAQQHE